MDELFEKMRDLISNKLDIDKEKVGFRIIGSS